MTADIVAYGEPMVEFNRTGNGGARLYLQGFGGDTSNFAIAAARQGAGAAYVTALGDDPYGRMFRTLWAEEGVDASGVKTDAEAPTAVYFVDHDEAGHHFSFFRKGSAASRFRPADLPRALLDQARFFHLSGISLAISETACDAGLEAMMLARQAGAAVSFDTNLRLKLWPKHRARAVITEAIRLTDICLPSLDDIVALGGPERPEAIVDWCLGLGARIVALKLGAEGALIADKNGRTALPPHPCTPVDATGAGDCFGGAFIARLAAGDDPVSAGRYAGVAAALSTEGYGAVAPIPRAAAVLAALSR